MGFLRFSEVIKLRRCDIIKIKTFLSIFIDYFLIPSSNENNLIYLSLN